MYGSERASLYLASIDDRKQMEALLREAEQREAAERGQREQELVRQRNAALYRRLLGECGLATSEGTLEEGADIAPLSEHHEGRHVYNQFVVRARRRDELRSFLSSRGIGTEVYYPRPMHLQTCFDAWRYAEGDFPESERAAAETVALPVYPELTPPMIEQVVGAVTEFYKGAEVGTLPGGG